MFFLLSKKARRQVHGYVLVGSFGVWSVYLFMLSVIQPGGPPMLGVNGFLWSPLAGHVAQPIYAVGAPARGQGQAARETRADDKKYIAPRRARFVVLKASGGK